MAAPTIKSDPIQNDKTKFRTQMVNGKPQIFFDIDDDSSTKARPKRNSRASNNISRLAEQPKGKVINPKFASQNGPSRTEQPTKKMPTNADGSSLGVYMTMDELSELVKAVKENAKTDTQTIRETYEPSPPPQQYYAERTTAPIVPKLDLPTESLPPPARVSPRDQSLSIMADKKRQKWMREKAEIERMQLEIEYDQLKHQLSPRHKKTSVSPERSTFQYDFPPPPVTAKPPPPSAPPLPLSLKQTDHQHDIPPKMNEGSSSDAFKTQLMEKKQQQWKQENSERMPVWNPFGRPGAGAPKPPENQFQTPQPPSHTIVPYRPSVSQQMDNSSSSLPPSYAHSDQTKVPAAMRTNLLFGDVRFEDDIKTVKEIERRQWLDDLHKQIEDNKRHKVTQQETDRRKDFLNESMQPLLQEAANRHQQPRETPANNGHQSVVQQTYDRSHETGEPPNYDKRAQLMDKLKRNGYQTDSLVKAFSDPGANETTGEKLFGPTYDSSSSQNPSNKVETLHLNVAVDHQQPYRQRDARRDEAINTVDSTFRSDHSVHTDSRMAPRRQTVPYAYEESDLPPQVPNPHYRNAGYRNTPNQPGKKNPRMRSLDDNHGPLRRTSTTTYHSNVNDDGSVSQMSNHQGPVDAQNRPLWNYKNSAQREYIPNSKRDPHYEKRQRLKHFEQGNFDRIDDVQKKTCYNRWNSDSEIQQQHKKQPPANRVRSTISKATSYGTHKDESIMNLLKGQNKQQQEAFGTRKPPPPPTSFIPVRSDEQFNHNPPSSLDKYDGYVPYIGTDDVVDPGRVPSPASQKQLRETNTNDYYQQQEWENTNQANPSVQTTRYDPPSSRQEHILQQLSAIKENLVRRQRELASSINPIPV